MFMDIETSPCIGYFWRPGRKVSIPAENIVKESDIVCICWKWAGETKVNSLDWGVKQNSTSMLKKFIKEAKKAEVIIGHNSDKFDIKWVKTLALKRGLDALCKITSVDTLKLARTNFNFNSNRLDYLGKVLGVGGKEETGGFSLWSDVMNSNKQALKDMIKYCKRDVVLLEDVYNKIAPHVASFTVHGGVLRGGNRASCPNPGCGSSKVQRRGTRVTAAGVKQQNLSCMDCRHNFSMPLSMANKIYGV